MPPSDQHAERSHTFRSVRRRILFRATPVQNTKDPNSDLLQTEIERAKREPVCFQFSEYPPITRIFFFGGERCCRGKVKRA